MKNDRLTERDEMGKARTHSAYNGKGYYVLNDIVEKLCELEDKIENGALIELPLNGTTENMSEFAIGFFIKHNAEVRKQAVEEFAERFHQKVKESADSETIDGLIEAKRIVYRLVNEARG